MKTVLSTIERLRKADIVFFGLERPSLSKRIQFREKYPSSNLWKTGSFHPFIARQIKMLQPNELQYLDSRPLKMSFIVDMIYEEALISNDFSKRELMHDCHFDLINDMLKGKCKFWVFGQTELIDELFFLFNTDQLNVLRYYWEPQGRDFLLTLPCSGKLTPELHLAEEMQN